MTSQSGLLSLPDSRVVCHSLSAKPAKERDRVKVCRTGRERTGTGRVRENGPGGCLGSFCARKWERGKGNSEVGSF